MYARAILEWICQLSRLLIVCVFMGLYLMKFSLVQSFLHGFDDDDSIKILNKCREAIPAKGGKLIIVEIVVDIDGTLEFARPRLCMDLELGMFWGKERTKDEWKNLLTKAETIR